jgi:hypothetical protein
MAVTCRRVVRGGDTNGTGGAASGGVTDVARALDPHARNDFDVIVAAVPS